MTDEKGFIICCKVAYRITQGNLYANRFGIWSGGFSGLLVTTMQDVDRWDMPAISDRDSVLWLPHSIRIDEAHMHDCWIYFMIKFISRCANVNVIRRFKIPMKYTSWYYRDEQDFVERYRCKCGTFRGRQFEDELCPFCDTRIIARISCERAPREMSDYERIVNNARYAAILQSMGVNLMPPTPYVCYNNKDVMLQMKSGDETGESVTKLEYTIDPITSNYAKACMFQPFPPVPPYNLKDTLLQFELGNSMKPESTSKLKRFFESVTALKKHKNVNLYGGHNNRTPNRRRRK